MRSNKEDWWLHGCLMWHWRLGGHVLVRKVWNYITVPLKPNCTPKNGRWQDNYRDLVRLSSEHLAADCSAAGLFNVSSPPGVVCGLMLTLTLMTVFVWCWSRPLKFSVMAFIVTQIWSYCLMFCDLRLFTRWGVTVNVPSNVCGP